MLCPSLHQGEENINLCGHPSRECYFDSAKQRLVNRQGTVNVSGREVGDTGVERERRCTRLSSERLWDVLFQRIGDGRGPRSNGLPITKVAERCFDVVNRPFLDWVQSLHV